jgi:predicted CoA-binding protein
MDDMCELPAFRTSDADAGKLLLRAKTIAVVGCSTNPDKPSHHVPCYLQQQGFRIVPVNPTVKGQQLLGETVYGSLNEIPIPVDVVDIFRPPKDVPPIVEEAIAIGAKAIWMQEGIVNNGAAERAKAAGLQVVMDKCMMKVHRSITSQGGTTREGARL